MGNAANRALERVANKGGEIAVKALLQHLAHTDAEVRRAAAYTLENVARNDTTVVTEALVQSLQDTDAKVRKAAARALETVAFPEGLTCRLYEDFPSAGLQEMAVKALMQNLAHTDAEVRKTLCTLDFPCQWQIS